MSIKSFKDTLCNTFKMSASLRQLVVLCQELMSNFRQQHADGCISLTRHDFLLVFYNDLMSRP